MADHITAWENLTCLACGGGLFAQLVELRIRPGHGMTPAPKGWVCQQCQTIVNPHDMQNAAEIRRIEREMQQQQAHLQSLKAR